MNTTFSLRPRDPWKPHWETVKLPRGLNWELPFQECGCYIEYQYISSGSWTIVLLMLAVAWMNLDIANSSLVQIYNIAPTKPSTSEAVSYLHPGMCGLASLQLCLSCHFFYRSCLPATLPVGDDISQSPNAGRRGHTSQVKVYFFSHFATFTFLPSDFLQHLSAPHHLAHN